MKYGIGYKCRIDSLQDDFKDLQKGMKDNPNINMAIRVKYQDLEKEVLDSIKALDIQTKEHEKTTEFVIDNIIKHTVVIDCYQIAQDLSGIGDGFYSIREDAHNPLYKLLDETYQHFNRSYMPITLGVVMFGNIVEYIAIKDLSSNIARYIIAHRPTTYVKL